MTARLQVSNLLQKAKQQSSIADEQTTIAKHDVLVAQDQVAASRRSKRARRRDFAVADDDPSQRGDDPITGKEVLSSEKIERWVQQELAVQGMQGEET